MFSHGNFSFGSGGGGGGGLASGITVDTPFTPVNAAVSAGQSVLLALEELQGQINAGIAGGVTALNSKSGALNLLGTSNEIIINNSVANTITLSTPQAIAVTSAPAFASLTLSSASNQIVSNSYHFTIPQTADSNAVIPSSAPPNQFAAGINSSGVISYLQPSFSNISGTALISQGGTSHTTANDSFNALAPAQTGNAGMALITDGTNTSWGFSAASNQIKQISIADSPYSLSPNDRYIWVDCRGGIVTINLYADSSFTSNNPQFTFVKTDDTTNAYILQASSGMIIINANSTTSNVNITQNESINIVQDSVFINWRII